MSTLPLDIQLSRGGGGWNLACILLIKEIAFINSLWNINWNLKIKQEMWYSRKENLPYKNGSKNIIWNLRKYLSFIFIVWRYKRGIEKPYIHKSKTMEWLREKGEKTNNFLQNTTQKSNIEQQNILILSTLKYIRGTWPSKVGLFSDKTSYACYGINVFGSHL